MSLPQLNTPLKLEVALRTRDDSGGYTTAWTYLGDLWAQVKLGTGKDAEHAGLPVSTVTYKITVRAAPIGSPRRPVAGQRFREGERIYAILAVAEEKCDRRYLTVFARDEEVMA